MIKNDQRCWIKRSKGSHKSRLWRSDGNGVITDDNRSSKLTDTQYVLKEGVKHFVFTLGTQKQKRTKSTLRPVAKRLEEL